MNLIESILKQGGGALVGQLAKSFGINEKMAEAAVRGLTPALTRGMQRNTKSEQGLDSLTRALERGKHDRTVSDLNTLDLDATIKEGNDVLGHILGSKDVSRNVAGHVSKQSGVSSGLLKKMLPVVAMIVMGMMKKKMRGAAGGTAMQPRRSGGGGLIRGMLDADNDGSIWDDILSLAVKLF